MRRRAVVVALVVGCHGGGDPQPPRTHDACVNTAHHMLDLMTTKDAPPETSKKIDDLIVTRCEQDAWSPEAQQCLSAMKSIDDQEPCQSLLTVRQRDALAKGIDEVFPRPKQP